MNICVAGWHYGPGLQALKERGAYVVGHGQNGQADVVIPNVGLEFGCYDHYLKRVWQGGRTLFTHDDNEFSGEAIRAIEAIDADQAFLFAGEEDAKANGFCHGRAMVCSDRFLRRMKAEGGFWFDESNHGLTPGTTAAPDYHNNGIVMFRSYLEGCNFGMRVGCYEIVEGMTLGYRGGKRAETPPIPVRLNLACGQMILPGYVNVDIHKADGVDFVCDIRKLPYADGSIDEILLIHAIEHFTYDDAVALLRSAHRMLKSGGRLIVEAPDVFKAVLSGKPQADVIRGIFGDLTELRKGKTGYQHLWGWTAGLMASEMKNAGFRVAEITNGATHDRPWRDFRVTAIKD